MRSRLFLILLGLLVVAKPVGAFLPVLTTDPLGIAQGVQKVAGGANRLKESIAAGKTLQKTMTSLGTAKKSVSEYISNVKKDIAKKKEKIAKYKKKAAEYKAKVEAAKKRAKELKEKAQEVKNKVNEVKTKVNEFKDTVDQIKDTVGDLEKMAEGKLDEFGNKIEDKVGDLTGDKGEKPEDPEEKSADPSSEPEQTPQPPSEPSDPQNPPADSSDTDKTPENPDDSEDLPIIPKEDLELPQPGRKPFDKPEENPEISAGYGYLHNSEPLGFASVLDSDDMDSNSTEDDVLIVPESLSASGLEKCALGYKKAIKPEKMNDCLREANRIKFKMADRNQKESEDVARDIENGLLEYYASSFFEAFNIYNDTLTYKTNIYDPVINQDIATVQDAWKYTKEMSQQLGERINQLAALWSRESSIELYKIYFNNGLGAYDDEDTEEED